MPRSARKKSKSGIYHIILRGINRQTVFEDEEDYEKFLQVIQACREKSGFKLMAYCLMGNHLHLLIREEKEELEQIFKRMGASYVYWYNHKYNRTGHLFQDRFRSEPVDDDGYYLTVLRYIHQNPVKAGLCKNAGDYKWSSCNDYIHGFGITDTEFGLSLFSEEKEEAGKLFEQHMKEEEKIKCLDPEENNRRVTDGEARELIKKLSGVENTAEFQKMAEEKRDKSIAKLKSHGLSIRQISRLTGISFAIVRKV